MDATPPLTRAEERSLIPLAQAGDKDATARIVTSHLPHLHAEARRHRGAARHLPQDDYVAAGCEAMLGALKTFDPSRGTRFITHARGFIRPAMSAVSHAAYPTPVPGRTMRKVMRALRATNTVDEAVMFAQVTEGLLPQTFAAAYTALVAWKPEALKANSSTDGDDDGDGHDEREPRAMLPTRGERPGPNDPAVRFVVRAALLSLTDRQRTVLEMTVMSWDPMKDSEVAAHLGVSRPTVTRTRLSALATLREIIGVDPRSRRGLVADDDAGQADV